MSASPFRTSRTPRVAAEKVLLEPVERVQPGGPQRLFLVTQLRPLGNRYLAELPAMPKNRPTAGVILWLELVDLVQWLCPPPTRSSNTWTPTLCPAHLLRPTFRIASSGPTQAVP